MNRVFPGTTSSATDPDRVAGLQRQLLAWYRRSRRDLPWRRTRDPYRIWVSEVMLQQTQIATTLPFYQSFLERFPTVEHLARAGEADVLRAWSGLGYYRRARHLLAAARTVLREHDGEIPRDEESFGRLPGVGRYTRGAVLSIAFDLPLAVLDGNVARVLSRAWAVPHAVRDPRGARALWALADTLVPMRSAGDWNQALMELGATICTPRSPSCQSCPVRRFCKAFGLGVVDRYPPVLKRPETVRVRRAVAWIEHDGRALLVRRESSLMNGMWEMPGVDLPPRTASGRAPGKLRAELERLGLDAVLEPTPLRLKHQIMNRSFEVEVWKAPAPHGALRRKHQVPASRAFSLNAPLLSWVDLSALDVPVTGLTRKVARALHAYVPRAPARERGRTP